MRHKVAHFFDNVYFCGGKKVVINQIIHHYEKNYLCLNGFAGVRFFSESSAVCLN